MGSSTSMEVAVFTRRDRFCSAAGASMNQGSPTTSSRAATILGVPVVLDADEAPLQPVQAIAGGPGRPLGPGGGAGRQRQQGEGGGRRNGSRHLLPSTSFSSRSCARW